MDPEPSRSFRDVVAAVREHSMDVLPFGLGQRRNGNFFVCLRHIHLGTTPFKGRQDVVHVGRLWQKIDRAQLDRVDRRRNAPKPG